MQVEFEPETETTIKATVTVPAERCDEAYQQVVAELRKDYNVPGFRNNEKVPIDMLVQAAGGERQVKFACLEQVMHSTITEVRPRSSQDIRLSWAWMLKQNVLCINMLCSPFPNRARCLVCREVAQHSPAQ